VLPAGDFQRLDRRERARQIGLGLRGIDLAVDRHHLQACIRDPRALLLDLHIAAGKGQTLFDRPIVHIRSRHFGNQQHQRVVIVLDGTVQAGIGRFDRAAKPTPKIQFPRQAGTQPPVAEIAQTDVARLDLAAGTTKGRCVGTALRLREIAKQFLRLRKQISYNHGPLLSSLDHAKPGFTQRNVLLVGTGDQAIERRVLKDRPPLTAAGRSCFQPRVGRIAPVIRPN